MQVDAGGRETSGVTTRLILSYVQDHGGDAALDALLRVADVSESRAELQDETRWVSYTTRIRLFEAAVEVLKDPRCPLGMGATALRDGLNHSVVLVLRALGSPRQVYRQLPRSVPKFSTTSTMEMLECGSDHAVIRYTLHEGYQHSRLDCLYAQGLIGVVPNIFGLPAAEIRHEECESDGAPACIYHLSWAERSRMPFRRRRHKEIDPELVALRGQLQKLQSTAAELVGGDDLETVLRRITDRAAAAVVAPMHLLAVLDPETSKPRVYGVGIPEAQVGALATQLLEGGDLGPNVVAVEVRSARRHYGRLAAIYPTNQRGPENERFMLTAYAGHAAVALDLLLALESSRRQESRSAALLALAHQLRAASDATTAAEVVVSMLPQIVGCDASSIRVWDPALGQLSTLASSGLSAGERALWDAKPIRADDTPEMLQMLTHQETALVTRGETVGPLREWLEAMNIEGVAATPLLADQTLLGVATAWWRPGQLPADTAEAMVRLQGVGEYAATALHNARLWSTLQHQSLHDALTGLPNRLLLTRLLERTLAEATTAEGVTVLYCDLDRFKRVNDSWGHLAGDELLRQVAARLRGVLRPGDTVARLSGDEFALLLPGLIEPDAATAVAERVLGCFAEPFRIDGRMLRVTTSVGIATHIGPSGRVDQLLRTADAGMYTAKQRGRNQLGGVGHGQDAVAFGAERADDRDEMSDVTLERELREALAGDQLRLVFQPLVQATDATDDWATSEGLHVVGAEALLRWQHPRLGLLAPAAFLTLAEDLGLIAEFDLWAIEAAVTALASWPADLRANPAGARPLHVAVNLSSAALVDPRLFDVVRGALMRAGLEAAQLHLEVVESRALLDVPAVVERLGELRRLGVRIALDDFGTGYSTLSWLQRLPVDCIKIDRTFISDLGGSPAACALVQGILALAAELRIEVVAEGVETPEQLDALRRSGCRLFQGYLLGRPQPGPPVLAGALDAARL
ncbi:MAG: hypothetical protein QOC98_1848 [Frankiaceae bacterium]|nr:hypothetical protein [Frankiaceae bacterium]